MKQIKTSQWVISGLLFLSVFLIFYYTDLTSLTIWSTNIWDCIFGEGIKNFYSYSSMNVAGVEHAIVGNDLLIYIPWALWNLPIWLLSKVMGISVASNVFMMFYSKMFLLFVFSGILYVTSEIGKVLNLKEEGIMQVLYLASSSAFLLTSVAYAGQNDTLPIFFFLLAILALLKGKKYSFLFYAAISIAMKPYMLFSVIILILLLEKKPWRILRDLGLVFSVCIVQKLILSSFPYYQEAMNSGAADGEIGLLLSAKIQLAQYDVSVLVLVFGILAVLAYFKRPDQDERAKYIMYYATAPILAMFAVAGYSFYRPIYLLPLLYICIVTNENIPVRFQIFLEVGMVTMMYYQFLRVESLFYNPYYINNGLFGRLFDTSVTKGYSFQELIMRRSPHMPYYFSISSAILLVIILILLVINHPKFAHKLPLEAWERAKWVDYVRIALFAVFILLGVSGLFI